MAQDSSQGFNVFYMPVVLSSKYMPQCMWAYNLIYFQLFFALIFSKATAALIRTPATLSFRASIRDSTALPGVKHKRHYSLIS